MADRLQPQPGFIFESGKVYTHSVGLSCCYRQWRAQSHCNKLHGYSLQVKITFRSKTLDQNNWVQDFGSLKWLKIHLENTFDHKTLIAQDDPELGEFTQNLKQLELVDLVVVDHVGCEAFAKMIFEYADNKLAGMGQSNPGGRVFVQEVEVSEHEGNFARYRRI